MDLTELTILQHLINNEEYCRKTIPFIEKDYFTEEKDKVVFDMIQEHIDKYNESPSPVSLQIMLDELTVSDMIFKDVNDTINVLGNIEDVNQDWLVDPEKISYDGNRLGQITK